MRGKDRFLINKAIQAVADGAAIMEALIGPETTVIRLIPTVTPEDFEDYWEEDEEE